MDADTRRQVAGVRDWYDQTAIAFRERYGGSTGESWRLLEENLALELLDRDPGAPLSRILDLGCGPGRLSASLSALAFLVIGIDVAPGMVILAHKANPAGNAVYAISDAVQSGLKGDSFDAIVSLGMFEYLDDPSPFLIEILRLLKPGGQLIFTCHNRTFFAAWRRSLPNMTRRPGIARDAFYRSVDHVPRDMLALLARRGFVAADFRGYHSRFATSMLRFAYERLSPGTIRGTCAAMAVAADRRLGMRAFRSLAPLAMYSARKP
jgi:SAM-dependent methyltransferase